MAKRQRVDVDAEQDEEELPMERETCSGLTFSLKNALSIYIYIQGIGAWIMVIV